MDQPFVAIKIRKPQNDAAKRYQSFVLLNGGREITVAEAIGELIAIGAVKTLPADALESLDLAIPSAQPGPAAKGGKAK